jgi:hypothetical protein
MRLDMEAVASSYGGYRCPRCGIAWGDTAAAIVRAPADGRTFRGPSAGIS